MVEEWSRVMWTGLIWHRVVFREGVQKCRFKQEAAKFYR